MPRALTARADAERALADAEVQYQRYLSLTRVSGLGVVLSDDETSEASGWRDFSHPLGIAIKTGPTNAFLESATHSIP